MASSKPFLGGVTGGVCKEQGRIHRTVVTVSYTHLMKTHLRI